MGTRAGRSATIVADICRKKGRASDVALLRDLCPVMETQSLCEMGRVMARTVLSALDAFGSEIEQHFTKKVCPAGECRAYMTYHILPTKCVGCGACVDACEDEAILGKPRFIHVIDQKACTQCGRCVSACDEEAIIMAGADKPRAPPRPIPIRRR
nr:4Fe-4S binding protein [Olsenella sp. An290]